MSDQEQVPETLAVFVLDSGAAAKRLLEAVEKIDEVNDNVQIVDAAIAERTKRRGAVKVHQTRDRGALKGGVRGTAIGVVVGTIIAGPAGAVVAGAAGGLLHSLRSRFHDIGIDDKFMKQVSKEIEKGKSALFVQYTGHLGRVDRVGRAGDPGRERPAHHQHAARRDRGRTQGAGRARRRITGRRRGGRRLRDRGRGGPRGGPRGSRARCVAADAGAGDDLTQLVGIGPKAASALTAAGIATYAALSEANEPQIRRALHDADMTPPGNVSTWPMQASLASKGDWQGLMKLNEKQRAAAKPAAPRTEAAAAAPPDDLTQINGIGPRISTILNEGGITTYADLQRANTGELRQIIAVGGALPPSSLESWPTQASYAARGDWSGLATYNRR